MDAVLELVTRIIYFVVFLGVLVFLHEFGHYFFAKLFKIEVEEFGFGFPPRMVKLFRIAETDFTINWIPFGAFVRPKGENDPTVPGGMASAAPWKRFFILLGGPLFNIVTAIIVFSIVFNISGVPLRGTVAVKGVTEGSPAATAGLLADDLIVSVQGQSISDSNQLIRVVGENLGKEIDMVYSRGGQNTSIKITPRENPPKGQGAIGITLGTPVKDVTFFQAVPYATYDIYYQAKMLVSLPGMLLRGEISPDQARVVGPIGMEEIVYSAAQQDEKMKAEDPSAAPLAQLSMLGLISAALGITNLLPIPALDGGRILFVLPEMLFRKRIPTEMENVVNMVGFLALLLMLFVVSGQDIYFRWFSGN